MKAKLKRNGRTPVLAGFTLIEMLVVIAIILILLRMLMPALSSAKDKAYDVVCGSQLHQLSIAFFLFANDHDAHLPGNWYDNTNADPDKRDWLCTTHVALNCNPATTPNDGTIFKYAGRNKKIYLCPKRTVNFGAATEDSSNGFSDYAALGAFAGASLKRIPTESLYDPIIGATQSVITPIIVEESGKSTINGLDMEGDHGTTDKLSINHNGASYYVSAQGSVHRFKEALTTNTFGWSGHGYTYPNSNFNYGFAGITWGMWDTN